MQFWTGRVLHANGGGRRIGWSFHHPFVTGGKTSFCALPCVMAVIVLSGSTSPWTAPIHVRLCWCWSRDAQGIWSLLVAGWWSWMLYRRRQSLTGCSLYGGSLYWVICCCIRSNISWTCSSKAIFGDDGWCGGTGGCIGLQASVRVDDVTNLPRAVISRTFGEAGGRYASARRWRLVCCEVCFCDGVTMDSRSGFKTKMADGWLVYLWWWSMNVYDCGSFWRCGVVFKLYS